jgi:TrmH family RNA methyltransferase
MARVRVVLVRPERPANVGAVARVARNTGLVGIDLVAPGDWRTLECWRTAWGAEELLEQAREFGELAAALEGASLAVAFSGRSDRGAPASDVREVAASVSELGAEEQVSLVFGPESAGLRRDEIALCGRRARIPADPAQPSLNLSHAVMVAGYEVHRARRRAGVGPRRASHEEKQAMLGLLRRGLASVGALPEARQDRYFEEWRALFQRMDLTPKELKLLEHMSRKMIAAGARAGRAAAEGD